MAEYLKLAYELKELMNSDPRFIRLEAAEKAMENNEEVMALTYNKDLKETYLSDALKHYASTSPEVKKARLELYRASERLDMHPLVKEYLKAYKDVEEVLKEINDILLKDVIKKHENCRR